MDNIRKFLEENILITDGAMGTYFQSLVPNADYQCELGCLNNKEIVEKIHREYIQAGAKLIRTNTFGAVSSDNAELMRDIVENAVDIAKQAILKEKKDVFAAASVGPAADADVNTGVYKDVIDIFIEKNIDIFIFETFNGYKCLLELAEYIKEKNRDAFVVTQFALTDVGVTKKSVYAESIIENLKENKNIDAVGFNCGVGPMHMFNIINSLKLKTEIMTALPNAGYPEIINGRVEYVMNPKYFARMVYDISRHGVKIVGGCCGTTPEHIRLLSRLIAKGGDDIIDEPNEAEKPSTNPQPAAVSKNKFHNALDEGKFLIAVELDPPFKADAGKLIDGAGYLKKKGADIITIADSPMGKARADSIVISSKIKRETGIDTLPHICCRDRNSVALRSAILGAYIDGIRSFLAITGDPVPIDARVNTKSVFNLNSYSLIGMIEEMNNSVFENDKVKIGAAVNLNVKKKSSELKRLLKKREYGAEFFLTQPIFTQETVDFLKKTDVDRDYKILGGIMPIISYKNAQFINNELPGISIPDEYVKRFSPNMTREEAQETGIEIAVEMAEKIMPYVDGLYFTTPFNRYEMVGEIISRLRI